MGNDSRSFDLQAIVKNQYDSLIFSTQTTPIYLWIVATSISPPTVAGLSPPNAEVACMLLRESARLAKWLKFTHSGES
jgi:hypothetical protein